MSERDKVRHTEASLEFLQDENEERITELRSVVNKMKEGANSIFEETQQSQPVLNHIEDSFHDIDAVLKNNIRIIDALNEGGSNTKRCLLVSLLIVLLFILLYYFLGNSQ